MSWSGYSHLAGRTEKGENLPSRIDLDLILGGLHRDPDSEAGDKCGDGHDGRELLPKALRAMCAHVMKMRCCALADVGSCLRLDDDQTGKSFAGHFQSVLDGHGQVSVAMTKCATGFLHQDALPLSLCCKAILVRLTHHLCPAH